MYYSIWYFYCCLLYQSKKKLAIASAIATVFSGLIAINEYVNIRKQTNRQIDEINQDFAQDIDTLKTVHTNTQDHLLSCESLVDSLKTMNEEVLEKWEEEHDKFTTTVTNVKELETSVKTSVQQIQETFQRIEETLEENAQQSEQEEMKIEESLEKLREQVDSLKQAFKDSSLEDRDQWLEKMQKLESSLKTILDHSQEQKELIEQFSTQMNHAVSKTSAENIGAHTEQKA